MRASFDVDSTYREAHDQISDLALHIKFLARGGILGLHHFSMDQTSFYLSNKASFVGVFRVGLCAGIVGRKDNGLHLINVLKGILGIDRENSSVLDDEVRQDLHRVRIPDRHIGPSDVLPYFSIMMQSVH